MCVSFIFFAFYLHFCEINDYGNPFRFLIRCCISSFEMFSILLQRHSLKAVAQSRGVSCGSCPPPTGTDSNTNFIACYFCPSIRQRCHKYSTYKYKFVGIKCECEYLRSLRVQVRVQVLLKFTSTSTITSKIHHCVCQISSIKKLLTYLLIRHTTS